MKAIGGVDLRNVDTTYARVWRDLAKATDQRFHALGSEEASVLLTERVHLFCALERAASGARGNRQDAREVLRAITEFREIRSTLEFGLFYELRALLLTDLRTPGGKPALSPSAPETCPPQHHQNAPAGAASPAGKESR